MVQQQAIRSSANVKSHPHQPRVLLCCVCHEQNAAYYEVVFNAASSNHPHQSCRKDQAEEEEDGGGYYNFPVRHPRHGHLQWSLHPDSQLPTYPDYPVHIRTTTLAKRTKIITSKEGKLKKG